MCCSHLREGQCQPPGCSRQNHGATFASSLSLRPESYPPASPVNSILEMCPAPNHRSPHAQLATRPELRPPLIWTIASAPSRSPSFWPLLPPGLLLTEQPDKSCSISQVTHSSAQYQLRAPISLRLKAQISQTLSLQDCERMNFCCLVLSHVG